ncbi:hypothetical protein [Citrobacter sedlakii]|uniref:hypothetical protein n=1 Tax=Citrobacter sedlakii TaxID=67826 RepID=UPI0020BE1D8E|nr:hypothetical protein [Citrobacter sedlakii]MCK8148096.1 hypothetical protein [Citrobacter sedlakii]
MIRKYVYSQLGKRLFTVDDGWYRYLEKFGDRVTRLHPLPLFLPEQQSKGSDAQLNENSR